MYRQQRLSSALRALREVDACAERLGFSKSLTAGLCEQPSNQRGLLQLMKSTAFLSHVHVAQTSGDEWDAVGSAFLVAIGSLPQPFAIVESGNLCGATTLFLAVLKRAFCRACPIYSIDPGLYRTGVGQPVTCAGETLEWAGLRAEVILIDGSLSASVELELPVGFVYLDDGKIRFCWLDEKMMHGAVIAMDDGQ